MPVVSISDFWHPEPEGSIPVFNLSCLLVIICHSSNWDLIQIHKSRTHWQSQRGKGRDILISGRWGCWNYHRLRLPNAPISRLGTLCDTGTQRGFRHGREPFLELDRENIREPPLICFLLILTPWYWLRFFKKSMKQAKRNPKQSKVQPSRLLLFIHDTKWESGLMEMDAIDTFLGHARWKQSGTNRNKELRKYMKSRNVCGGECRHKMIKDTEREEWFKEKESLIFKV